jgi:hypothetical protein
MLVHNMDHDNSRGSQCCAWDTPLKYIGSRILMMICQARRTHDTVEATPLTYQRILQRPTRANIYLLTPAEQKWLASLHTKGGMEGILFRLLLRYLHR